MSIGTYRLPFARTFFFGMVIVGAIYALVFAGNGPQPSVGLYWFLNSNPTAGSGISAPLNQLLIRTDTPSLYYKSGPASTAWTEIGAPGGGSGSAGTVSSILCEAGLTCTPNPITTTGDVMVATQFNIPGETILTAGGTLHDWDPWQGGPHTTRVEIDLNQPTATIDGIVAGSDGDELLLWNGGGGSNPDWVTLVNQGSASSALNRLWIADGKLVNIPNNDGVLLVYDVGFGWTGFGAATSIVRAQQLSLDPAAIPAALASGSAVNNYNPWAGLPMPTSYVQQDVTGSGTATITGISAAGAPNSSGRVVLWENISIAGSQTFVNGSGSSSGVNQILTPGGQSVTLPPGGSTWIVYDTTIDSWRVTNATIANALSGTVSQNAIAKGGATPGSLVSSSIADDGTNVTFSENTLFNSTAEFGLVTGNAFLSSQGAAINVTQNVNINSGGSGAMIFNGSAGGFAHSGTGGFFFESGSAAPTVIESFTNASGQFTLLDEQVFTTSGTYTPTTGTRAVAVFECGGGGGGGGGGSGGTGGASVGAGGASGVWIDFFVGGTAAITGGAVTIGAGGTSGVNTGGTGGNGASTSVIVNGVTTSTGIAPGGKGMASVTALTIAAAGLIVPSPTVPTGGTFGETSGQPGILLSTTQAVTGAGGSSPVSAGGGSLPAGATGTEPGSGPCSGGAGGNGTGATPSVGGAGRSGFVRIREYQ